MSGATHRRRRTARGDEGVRAGPGRAGRASIAALALSLAGAGGPLANAVVDGADALLVSDVRVVDVEAGTVGPPRDIEIANGRIVAIGPHRPHRPTEKRGRRHLDGRGAHVIPGLWDAHVHVFSSPEEPAVAFDTYLLAGVTGIRDMGGLLSYEAQRRIADEVESGARRGPRVVLSGAWVDAPPGSWPGMYLAATPEAARERVAEIAALGWAAVKAYSMLGRDTYLALAEASRTHGLPLVGHVPESVALADAVAAGQRAMEHFGRVTKACSTEEATMVARSAAALEAADPRRALVEEMATHNALLLDTWDEALCADVLAAMAEAGLHVAPTLMVSDFYRGVRPGADALRLRLLPAEVREGWAQPDFRLEAMTDELRALADRSVALDRRTFRLAHEAGVPILAGTDASWANPWLFHGFSLLDELDRYVEIGLTPREALLTATVAPARFLGFPDQDGRVAVGRRADLVLLDGDPLADLAVLRAPVAVVAHGRAHDRAALVAMRDALLAGARD